MKRIIVSIFLIMTLAFTGCQNTANPPVSPSPQPSPTTEVTPSHLFDAREVKLGDMIEGKEIVELTVNENKENSDQYSASVAFKGKITLSGTYTQHTNDEFLGNLISFKVDEKDVNKLPKLKQDERYLWFVFTNQEEAKQLFGEKPEGTAAIEIDNYKINYAPSEVYNEATLVKVVAKQ